MLLNPRWPRTSVDLRSKSADGAGAVPSCPVSPPLPVTSPPLSPSAPPLPAPCPRIPRPALRAPAPASPQPRTGLARGTQCALPDAVLGYPAAAAGPWPSDARLGVELLVCYVITPSMWPHKPMFIHYPESVSYRLFQRSQKQHLNSVTERHMTAFVFQNEPQHAPWGGPQLPPVPSEGGLLAPAHHPQTGCPGAKKEASDQASLV